MGEFLTRCHQAEALDSILAPHTGRQRFATHSISSSNSLSSSVTAMTTIPSPQHHNAARPSRKIESFAYEVTRQIPATATRADLSAVARPRPVKIGFAALPMCLRLGMSDDESVQSSTEFYHGRIHFFGDNIIARGWERHALALHIIRCCYNAGATAVLMETPVITEIIDSVAERDSVSQVSGSPPHRKLRARTESGDPSSCA